MELDQTKRTVKVVGLKLQAWEMEGRKGVTAEIYREVPLDGRRNGEDGRVLKGYTTAAIKVQADLLSKVSHLQPPFMCELTEQELSNGKTTQQVVVDLRPLAAAKAA